LAAEAGEPGSATGAAFLGLPSEGSLALDWTATEFGLSNSNSRTRGSCSVAHNSWGSSASTESSLGFAPMAAMPVRSRKVPVGMDVAVKACRMRSMASLLGVCLCRRDTGGGIQSARL
jgi:hypothetical protein